MNAPSQKLLVACAAGVALAYAVSLASMFATHDWLIDAQGHPLVTDFVAIWSAGHLVRDGAALSAYDVHLQHTAEVATVGHSFQGGLAWLYPPFFLLVAAALACLSYTQAFILWVFVTISGYAATVGAVVKHRAGALFALAAPWTLADIMTGQSGFLTASLFALVLLNLELRPVLSGIFLGLLTYKPQFGLLFPIALALGGHWRTFAWASVTALCLVGISAAVFGAATFAGFLHALPHTAQTLLVENGVGWNKLQSAYGFVRWLGLPDIAGWIVQTIMTIGCIAGVALLWRSNATAALKAAGLCVAALLATPYVFFYDLPLLGVAIAFLYRDRAFDRIEFYGVAFALIAAAAFVLVPAPTGLFAIMTIAALVARRAAICEAANKTDAPKGKRTS